MLDYNDEEFEVRLVGYMYDACRDEFDHNARMLIGRIIEIDSPYMLKYASRAAHALADLMRLHGMPTRNP